MGKIQLRRGIIGLSAAALAVAAVAGPAAAKKHRHAAKASLSRFHSCAALGRYEVRHSPKHRGPLLDTALRPSTPKAGKAPETGDAAGSGATVPDYSLTNVQEQGVDEPDLVKTDGSRIFVLEGGRLRAISAGGPPVELGSLAIRPRPGRFGSAMGDEMMFLHGDRILVFSPGKPGRTLISYVDVSSPAAMQVVSTTNVEGSFVSARLNDATARAVFSSAPQGHPVVPTAISRSLGASKPRQGKLVPCRSVRHPTPFSGTEMLTVLTIDMDRGLPAVDSDAITTTGDFVYGSRNALYVATESYGDRRETTAIHKFALGPDTTDYAGSGSVPGQMLSQWAMSERDGILRVASTSDPLSIRSKSQSQITDLADLGGRLGQVGQIRGLGRGQDVYAVRFVDDLAYVVTYKRIDPLYIIGLSDPAAPAVLGELEVRGYSSYLHPIGPGLLLGVGQDVDPAGAAIGTQLSIFDVHDPTRPQRLSQLAIADSSSAVEDDHLAFLYWAPEQLAVLPLEITDPKGIDIRFSGAIGVHAAAGAPLSQVGTIVHGNGTDAPVQRALVVGARLYSVSERGLMSSDPKTLATEAFLPFG